MKEQKQTTYGDLKCRKAELQAKIVSDNYDMKTVEEFRYLTRWIKQAEMMLLWSIACLIVFVALGCHTVNGVGRDLSAWSSPYIEHQER